MMSKGMDKLNEQKKSEGMFYGERRKIYYYKRDLETVVVSLKKLEKMSCESNKGYQNK